MTNKDLLSEEGRRQALLDWMPTVDKDLLNECPREWVTVLLKAQLSHLKSLGYLSPEEVGEIFKGIDRIFPYFPGSEIDKKVQRLKNKSKIKEGG